MASGLPSCSIAALLSVVSDKFAKAMCGATRVVARDMFKTFDRIWHPGLLHKLKSQGISKLVSSLIFSFPGTRLFFVVLDGKFLSKYSRNADVCYGFALGPIRFYYTLMTFLTILSVILLSMLMMLLSSLTDL